MSTAPVTVLLVEPHDDTNDMYAEYFRHSGFGVLAVSNATDALAIAPSADVIVTNIRLPDQMDGLELITRLRGDERTKHTPIVVVSAAAFPQDRERAQRAGCDVFLAKPCLPNALFAEVRRLASRSMLDHIRPVAADSGRSSSPGASDRETKRPA